MAWHVPLAEQVQVYVISGQWCWRFVCRGLSRGGSGSPGTVSADRWLGAITTWLKGRHGVHNLPHKFRYVFPGKRHFRLFMTSRICLLCRRFALTPAPGRHLMFLSFPLRANMTRSRPLLCFPHCSLSSGWKQLSRTGLRFAGICSALLPTWFYACVHSI